MDEPWSPILAVSLGASILPEIIDSNKEEVGLLLHMWDQGRIQVKPRGST